MIPEFPQRLNLSVKIMVLRPVILPLLVMICIGLSQCGGSSSFEHFGEGTRFVLRSDSALFRGIFTDMSLAKVKTHEQATLAEEEKDYLRYTHTGKPLDGQAEYEYFFAGQDQLDRIVATVQIYNEANLKQLREDVTTYYDNNFTKHEETENGLRKWAFDAPRGHDGTIEITIDTTFDKDGYTLSLNITKYYQY